MTLRIEQGEDQWIEKIGIKSGQNNEQEQYREK